MRRRGAGPGRRGGGPGRRGAGPGRQRKETPTGLARPRAGACPTRTQGSQARQAAGDRVPPALHVQRHASPPSLLALREVVASDPRAGHGAAGATCSCAVPVAPGLALPPGSPDIQSRQGPSTRSGWKACWEWNRLPGGDMGPSVAPALRAGGGSAPVTGLEGVPILGTKQHTEKPFRPITWPLEALPWWSLSLTRVFSPPLCPPAPQACLVSSFCSRELSEPGSADPPPS